MSTAVWSTAEPAPLCGIVLCGGRSRRMGRDKATLGPSDRPLAAQVAAALREVGAVEVVMVGGDRRRLAVHCDAWLPDDNPGSGPVAAIVTAARHRQGRDLLVCACDLPRLTASALTPLVDAVRGGARAAVVDVGGRPQWSVLALSAAAAGGLMGPLDAGDGSYRETFGAFTTHLSVAQDLLPAYRDADRPEELPPELRL